MKRTPVAHLLVAALLLCASGVPAAAFVGNTISVGGPGGSPFFDSCRPGDALVGVNFRAGKDLDSATALCAVMQNLRPVGDAYRLTARGEVHFNGQFGTRADLTCPPGMVVQQVHVTESSVRAVHKFSFTCRNLVTGEHADTYWSITNGGQGGAPGNANCGDDGYAAGLLGRSASLVNALGLMCAAMPAPPLVNNAPPPPANPAPPPKPNKPPLAVDSSGKQPLKVDNGN